MSEEQRKQDPDPPSRPRDPRAAVRGVGAAALAAEAVVLLLAIQPIRVLGANLPAVAIGVVLALAVLCLLLAGMLRHQWAWYVGAGLQIALFVSGFVFHASLAFLGVLFGLVWLYVLHVRRSVLASRGADPGSSGS